MKRKSLAFTLRMGLSAGILYLLLSRLDYGQLRYLLPNLVVPFFLLGFTLFLIDRGLMSYRWQVLLKSKGAGVPFGEIVRIYFMTSFLGMFVPSSVAPDAMRAYLASKYGCSAAIAMTSVFVDRFIGFLTLAAVALGSCGVLAMKGESELLSAPMVILILAPFAALLVWLFLHRFMVGILRRLAGFPYVSRIHGVLQDFYESMVSYWDHGSDLLRITALCFVSHLLFIVTVYLMTLSLNLSVSMVHLCIFVPLVSFVTMVPVSVGGLGIQEGAYVYLLMRGGLTVQEAFAVALLVRVVTTLGCLPGGVLYLTRGFEVRRAME